MGTRRHQGSFDEIVPKDPTLKLIRGGARPDTYKTFFGNLDFLPDDIPNWRAVIAIAGGGAPPTRINYIAGTSLPIPLAGFQVSYSQYGPNPRFTVEKITGAAALTADASLATTSAADGTYTAQALVNTTGIGTGATATVVVLAGVVTSITIVDGGQIYFVDDAFTIAAVPGATFIIATNDVVFYQNLTSSATIIKGEVTDRLPDSYSINVDDDGTGVTSDNLQITISN